MLAVRRLIVAALGAAVLFAAVLVAGKSARAEEPAFLTFGIGEYDVFHDNQAGDFMLEYRADRLWFIHPKAGFEFTTDGAAYFYGGFNFDVPMGRHFVLTLGTAVGHYSDGNGKKLGNAIEFKSGAGVALRLRNRARLGVELYHISNASMGDRNPGTEILGLAYSIPMGNLFQGQSARR
jgi:hypothetical protein